MPVNAKAVVDIDVNDRKFKEVISELKKFQDAVTNTRKEWQAIQKAQAATMQVQQQMIANMKQQSDVLRTMVGHAKTHAAHTESTFRHWVHMAGKVKEVGFHIVDITRKLASWGGLIGAALTGLSLFGIGSVARGITQGRAGGLGSGMTSGELKALESALGGGQYNLDIGSMAQASASARETPYGAAGTAYSFFGVNPNQKGNKAIVQLLKRIRRGVKAGEFTPDSAMDIFNAGDTGLTREGIRSFSALSDEEANKQTSEAFDTKKFDIPKDQERAWSDFYRYLSDYGEKVQTLVGKYMTPILDVLKENGEKFLKSLEHFLSSGEFKEFMDKLPNIVRELVGALEVVKDGLVGLARALKPWVNQNSIAAAAYDKQVQDLAKAQKDQKDKFGFSGSDIPSVPAILDYLKEQYKKNVPTSPIPSLDSGDPRARSGYQTGTDYVPKTGMYQLHQGEAVTSADEVERIRRESNKYSIDDALRVLTGHESGNSYSIRGKYVPGQGQAIGRYQIMPANVPSWTKEVLGYSMTPDEFARNPGAQDAVGRSKFASYVSKFGSIADALSAWASGQPLAKGAESHDLVFKSQRTVDYVRSRLAELSGGTFSGGGGGIRLDVNDNTGGNVGLNIEQMGLPPLPAFPL